MLKKAITLTLVCVFGAPIYAEKQHNSIFTYYQGTSTTDGKSKKMNKKKNDQRKSGEPLVLKRTLMGLLFSTPEAEERADDSQKIEPKLAEKKTEKIAEKNMGTEIVEEDVENPDDPSAELEVNPNKSDFGVTDTSSAILGLTENNEIVSDEITKAINHGQRLIVVVDKGIRSNANRNGQTMQVWKDGEWLRDFDWDVSTGRQKHETAKSGKRYFTTTPARIMTPYLMKRKHHSETWKADMPFAVFLKWSTTNSHGQRVVKKSGIAIHATTESHYAELGTRASGGCIRLTRANAKKFFDLVNSIGDMEKVTVISHDNGEIHY